MEVGKVFRARCSAFRIGMRAQAARFERLMAAGRTWRSAAFLHGIATHPFIGPVVHGLVWELRTERGTMHRGHLDGHQLIGLDGEPVRIADGEVSIVRCADLTDQALGHWSRHLIDYDLSPPFRQFDRARYWVSTHRGDDAELHSVPTVNPLAERITKVLRRLGWLPVPCDCQGFECGRWVIDKEARLRVSILAHPKGRPDELGTTRYANEAVAAQAWDGTYPPDQRCLRASASLDELTYGTATTSHTAAVHLLVRPLRLRLGL